MSASLDVRKSSSCDVGREEESGSDTEVTALEASLHIAGFTGATLCTRPGL